MSSGKCKLKQYHYKTSRMAEIQNIDYTKCWQACEATETLIHCWEECKISQTVRQCLTKRIIFLIYNSVIALLGIYVDEFKTLVHIKACTQTFIVSLVITGKTLRQLKCPSVGKWINKLFHPDNGIVFNIKNK